MIKKTGGGAARANESYTIMVEARGVEKTFATGGALVRAPRGVDLRVPRAEVVAVMGPSGFGKITTT